MNYREALAWLFGTQRFGIKLGLDHIRRLLDELQVPLPQQRIIHVAGTNGKGSVCAMIDSILRAEGYRSGLFTSPHLVTFRERIQVNGTMISEVDVAAGLSALRDRVREWEPHPTFFELATALGLHHFREQKCEVIVLETGMGGRLDATNAVLPVVSVITPIDLDHQKWLGNTLAEIAGEKAGIIKQGIPVVSAPQMKEAKAVLQARAAVCEAPLQIINHIYEKSPIALLGPHQQQNAAVALAALHSAKISVSDKAVQRGLASVTWPARFQRWNERTIIDGAHNPAGARVLAGTWRKIFAERKAVVVLAVLLDKDARGIIAALAPIADRFVLPKMRSERGVPPEELALTIKEVLLNVPIRIMPTVTDALLDLETADDLALVTGSLHFAGEALAILGGNPDGLEDCLQ